VSVTDSISPLVSNDDAAFKDFLRIYNESISVREQKSATEISAMLARPDYRIFLISRNTLTVGFSIVFVPIKESFCLLEYMAVDAAYRNSGLGQQLFLHSANNIFSKTGCIPMLLEVDSDHELSADLLIRRRRQQFYRRLNCLRIDNLPYILPLPGQGSPPQMDLMIYFKGPAQVVRKIQLQQWLKLIYHDVYNCSDEDPRINTMLKVVSDPIGIV
jgi:ribosomal protein S18 acetylase RimI-like enzyme